MRRRDQSGPAGVAAGGRGRSAGLLHPARVVVVAFVAASLVGAALLSTPLATDTGEPAEWSTALFTSVSAVSVTGLAVVGTETHWSPFGQGVILVLIQLGGFGVMALASLLGVVVFRRLGLRSRLTTQVELNELDLGGLRELLGRVFRFTLLVELTGFVLLTVAALATTDESLAGAAWFGLFHSVSAFNNAGFSTLDANLAPFATDPAVLVIVAVLVVVGGIGYPVVVDVYRNRLRWARWNLHTRITVATSGVLLGGGALAIGALEWTNPDTLGALSVPDRVTNAGFASITPRTAGFNTFDYGAAGESTLLVTIALMLIGGASGSTAGGIKVTTFAVLGFVIWAELRGERDVNAFGRRLDQRVQRQAVTVALVGVGLAMVGSVGLAALSTDPVGAVAFEVVSAVSTVGLSTGITADQSVAAHLWLAAIMLLGRLGPVTVGTALVLRHRQTLYRYPEGRPLLG